MLYRSNPQAADPRLLIGQAVLASLQQAGGLTFKTVPSSTPNTNYAHGPGGLFSHPALEQPLYSAIVTPWTGLQYMLPVRGTIKTDPLYGIVTGVTATSGSEPVGVCDDPPTVGLSKLCMQAYTLGRESRQTSVLDISRGDRVTDRGEHTDFQIFGSPMGMQGGERDLIPSLPTTFGDVAMSEVTKKLVEFMVAWSRDFAKVLYTGNPTNNTAGGGYKEPYGLDIIVNTGHRDAESGQLCPAADSIVRNFNSLNITTGGAAVSTQIVRLFSYIFRNLVQNSAQMNLAPASWVISMPFGLFYELTEIWPIAYATYRQQAIAAGSTAFVDGLELERMRADMRGDMLNRRGQYLLIDGQKVPVVIDDAIAETTLANGAMSANAYFIPITILNNREATFIEYFDYSSGNVLRQAQLMAPMDTYSVSDSGRFLLHKKPPTNFCTQLVGLTEWRVVCTVPQLAAKVLNVAYTPLIHERSGFTDSNYFVNGGRTTRSGNAPSYYSPS